MTNLTKTLIVPITPFLIPLAAFSDQATPPPATSLPKRLLDQKAVCQATLKTGKVRYKVDLEAPVEANGVKFGVGSHVSVRVRKDKVVGATFLGRVVNRGGNTIQYLFYESEKDLLYVVDESKLKFTFKGKTVNDKDLQPILDPLDQTGENCMAYALDHFIMQLSLNGVEDSGKLAERLSTEDGRTNLLVDVSNEYYENARRKNSARAILQHELDSITEIKPEDSAVLKKADALGLACKTLTNTTVDKKIEAMLAAIGAGSPVLLEFYIGPDMANSDSPVKVVGPDKTYDTDHRLWIPRAKGEKNGGGHSIVASAYFKDEDSGKTKLLIQDSDWTEPRIWDLDDYVRSRWESSGMLAHVCLPKK